MKGATIKLTDKQATELYNARCDLYHMISDLEDTVKPSVLGPIRRAIKALAPVLNPVHKADDQARKAVERQAKALRDLRDIESPGVYSTSISPNEQIRSLVNQRVRFVMLGAWVQEGKSDYKSKVYVSPTYGDAYEAFCESIDITGDTHHVFFEGVAVQGTDNNGEMIVELISGS